MKQFVEITWTGDGTGKPLFLAPAEVVAMFESLKDGRVSGFVLRRKVNV